MTNGAMDGSWEGRPWYRERIRKTCTLHSGISSHGGVSWTGIGPGLVESWGVSLLTNAYRNVTITIELKRQQSNTLISLGAKATEFPPVGPTSKRVG